MLAALSRETNFTRATKALEGALGYGADDPDSILAVFNRMNSQLVELDPLALSPGTPKMPLVLPEVKQYDRLFLKGGSAH